MTAGRRRVPTEIKKLTGNPGRRPLNPNEPKADPLDPTPPSWLTGEAVNFWNELVAVLVPMGHMSESDKSNLVSLSLALAQMKESHLRIETDGYVIDTPFGPKVSPFVGVLDKAQKQVKSLLCELGMTPASRAKVVSLTGTTKADPLTEFLEGGGEEHSESEETSGEDVH
jgi:P27 family predicted phage terminase small subunit